MRKSALIILFTLLAACDAWEHDVERGGFSFSEYRFSEGAGVHIGRLAEQANADGFICAEGEWAHFSGDWSLELCRLATPYRLGPIDIAAGAWVRPREDRLIVAFERDTPCGHYMCRGTGGSKGAQTALDWNGRLLEFFLANDTQINGVPCRASLIAIVQLHPNGGLKRCVAANAVTVRGRPYAPGETVVLDDAGQPQ